MVPALHARRAVHDRLLVVAGSQDVLAAYRSHFARVGFEVQTAETLEEAARRLAAEAFDAVIADVCGTPDRASQRLIAAARRGAGTSPVVVLTAYGEPERASAAARLPIDLFLHKPVSLVWLDRLIRSCIHHRRLPSGPAPEPSPAG